MSEYNELEQFNREFTPSVINRPGLESLSDGDYDFEIAGAELVRTEKQNELILRMSLKVLSIGSVIEKAYFFRNQQAVDILGADLCTLGVDADQWKPPHRTFSVELPRALPRLSGVRFRGKKVTVPDKKDSSKTYHNLYINNRIGAGSAPVGTTTPPVNGHVPANSDPIPF